MAKRPPVAPAPVANDDETVLPWDKPIVDGETEELWQDTPALEDAPADDRPLREVLSAISRQGVSSKMQERPLSAQSNQWIVTTYRRLNGLIADKPDAEEVDAWVSDRDTLEITAMQRGISSEELVGDVAEPPVELTQVETKPRREGKAVTKSASAIVTAAAIVPVPLKDIQPDPEQARDEGADADLADSIKANGVLQAIELRRNPGHDNGTAFLSEDGKCIDQRPFVIVDGERRYRGAIAAGLEFIPAVVTDQAENEGDRLIRQVVRNDGKRLKPMEEARTFKRIMAAKGFNIQQLADHLGKPKSTVSDRLAIVDVPREFAEYFEQGVLSAAAAPILRQLSDLPDRARARVVKSTLDNYEWDDAVGRARTDKKPIPLAGYGGLEEMIADALRNELRPIAESDAKFGVEYKGKVVTVGKTEYALDGAAYDAAVKKATAAKAQTAAPEKKKSSISAAQTKANADHRENLKKQKAAREREAAKREETNRLRDAQFAAVAAKIPDVIDGPWALALVRELAKGDAYDMGPEDLKAIGILAPKATANVEKLVVAHAEKLPAKGRIRLALQLLAFDPNPWGKEDRLADAAKLVKVDLKKIKLPELTEFPAGAKAKAKKRS